MSSIKLQLAAQPQESRLLQGQSMQIQAWVVFKNNNMISPLIIEIIVASLLVAVEQQQKTQHNMCELMSVLFN